MDGGSTGDEFLLSTTAAAAPLFVVMSVENCTEIYGNISVAAETDNVTCLGHAPELSNQRAIRGAVLAAMSILSLVGNVLTMLAIAKDERRTPLCTMVIHLSVADLFVSLFCLGGESVWTFTVSWNAGNAMCKVFKFWQSFGLYLSTYLVVVIGLDRWTAIAQPLRRSRIGKKLTRIYLLMAWILSAIFSLPQMYIFRVDKGPFVEEFYQCVTYGAFPAEWHSKVYSIITLLLLFVFPLIILIITYSSAMERLQKSERQFQRSTSRGEGEDATSPPRQHYSQAATARYLIMRKATKKSLKMSLFIVGGFLVCWIPYHSAMIIITFGLAQDKFGDDLMTAIFFFGMSNALINPLIYGAFHIRKKPRSSKQNHNSIVATKNHSVVHNNTECVRMRRIALGERFSFGAKGGGGGGGDVDGRPGSSHATIATTTEFVSAPRPQLLAVSGRSKTMDHESDFGDCGVSVSGAGSGSRGGRLSPAGASGRAPMSRCATFDCISTVDRRPASLKKREIRERLYEDVNGIGGGGGVMDHVPVVDYTREILGIREEGDGMSVATLD